MLLLSSGIYIIFLSFCMRCAVFIIHFLDFVPQLTAYISAEHSQLASSSHIAACGKLLCIALITPLTNVDSANELMCQVSVSLIVYIVSLFFKINFMRFVIRTSCNDYFIINIKLSRRTSSA